MTKMARASTRAQDHFRPATLPLLAIAPPTPTALILFFSNSHAVPGVPPPKPASGAILKVPYLRPSRPQTTALDDPEQVGPDQAVCRPHKPGITAWGAGSAHSHSALVSRVPWRDNVAVRWQLTLGTGFLALAMLLASCGGTPQAARSSTTTHPSSTTTEPILQGVDWANESIPGSICGVSGSIPLHNGGAVLSDSNLASVQYPDVYVSASGGWPSSENVAFGSMVYGPLGGAGDDAAGDPVWCQNGGGTGDSQEAQGYVIFMILSGQVSPIGVITPQKDSAPDSHIPIVTSIDIEPGQIVAQEDWYMKADATCCPTGRATTTWTYANGKLSPGPTQVT